METLLAIGLSNAVVATLLAGATAAISRLWRRPALTHALWLLVLLKLVTPSLMAVPLPALPEWPKAAPNLVAVNVPPVAKVPAEPTSPAEAIVSATEPVEAVPAEVPSLSAADSPDAPLIEGGPPPSATPQVSLTSLMAFLWLGTSAVWFVVAAWRVGCFGRLLRCGIRADDEVQQAAREIGHRLGLRRVPVVLLVPGTVSPLLWAFGGPARLLLPAALLARLEPGQLGTLLAHELAHYRRRDHWTRGLEMLATGLFWWHPVTWWTRYRLREAEEQCCDAWVVWALPTEARTYAHALMQTLDFLANVRPALPPTASAAGHFPLLKRRLAMIVQRTTPRSLPPAGWLALAALSLAVLPWSLSRGQSETEVVPPTTIRAGDTDEAERLRAEVAAARAEMERAQVKFREAADRLAQLERKAAAQSSVIRMWDVPAGQRQQGLAILEAQRKGRQAAVEEAEALLEKAQRHAERLKQLASRNTVTHDEVEDAISDVKVHAAQLRGKQAELAEIEARIAAEKGPVGVGIWLEQRLPTPPPPVAPPAPMKTEPTDNKAPSPEMMKKSQHQVEQALKFWLEAQENKRTPEEIEKKLDEVIRQVDELRKQLRDDRRTPSIAPSTPVPLFKVSPGRGAVAPAVPSSIPPAKTAPDSPVR